jgi:hypothetical protein
VLVIIALLATSEAGGGLHFVGDRFGPITRALAAALLV